MLNTSVISVFRTFSKAEIKRFEEFLLSPYYNKNSVLVNLFSIVKKYEPDFKSDLLDRKKVWHKLYKEKDFNYGVMKNLIYDLNKAADKFIELQSYEKNILLNQLSLMQEQFDRNLNDSFEKTLKNYKNKLSVNKQDLDYFYYNYRALKLEREFYSNIGIPKAESRISEENEIEYLTMFYLIECSDVYNSLLINASYINKNLKNENLNLFLNFSEKFEHKFREISESSLLNLKLILDENDYSVFFKLKNIFTKNSFKFSSSYNSNLGLALMEFCSRRIMEGKVEFIKEMFETSLYIFENGLLMNENNGYMNPNVFNQLISTGCSLKKFDWVRQFIEDNFKKLNPLYRENFYNYAYLTLNFKMKNFAEALHFSAKMEVASPMDHVSIKRYQMMIYFESGYTEELYSIIEAFRNYVNKSNKLTASVKSQSGNFINFTKKLSDLKFNSNNFEQSNIRKIKSDLMKSEVINKNWLMEKVNELDI